MEGFAIGMALASFLALLIVANRSTSNVPMQPMVYTSSEPPHSDSRLGWVVVLFLIIIVLLGLMKLQ